MVITCADVVITCSTIEKFSTLSAFDVSNRSAFPLNLFILDANTAGLASLLSHVIFKRSLLAWSTFYFRFHRNSFTTLHRWSIPHWATGAGWALVIVVINNLGNVPVSTLRLCLKEEEEIHIVSSQHREAHDDTTQYYSQIEVNTCTRHKQMLSLLDLAALYNF